MHKKYTYLNSSEEIGAESDMESSKTAAMVRKK